MNDNIKLLELANKGIEDDSNFFAFFLNRYLDIEQLTREEVINTLNCDLEKYYRLGLCKAPKVFDSEYLSILNSISLFIDLPVLSLNQIIKRVSSVMHLQTNTEDTHTSVLMAARDKNKTDTNSD